MSLDHYAYKISKSQEIFEFYSEGPKGRILKVVHFELQLAVNGTLYYNLAFGDWNEMLGKIDDHVITNNGDAEKVLETVAAIVLNFTKQIAGTRPVYVTGSNMARTRRYQMGINRQWDEIKEIYNIRGYISGRWEPFKRNINYEAFWIVRKEPLTLMEEETVYYMKGTKAKKTWKEFLADAYKKATVDPDMRDYSKEPAFIRKHEEARKFLNKAGIPSQYDNWQE